MTKGRLIALGDIHGCLNSLKLLIAKIDPQEDDRFVFMGDYIDRGAWVYETIEYLIEFAKKYDCIFLKGNHEDMWLKDLGIGDGGWDNHRMFMYNGGRDTLRSYEKNGAFSLSQKHTDEIKMGDLPPEHRKFLRNLVVRYDEDEFIFVHAGLRPNIDIDRQLDHDMLWIRNEFLSCKDGTFCGKVVVHGHSPMYPDKVDEVYNDKYSDRINVDTGCVFGDELRATEVRTRQNWSVGMVKRDR